MVFALQQKQEAYKKLSPEVQDFVMSNETTELIGNFLKEAGLSEEQDILADGEILYAMFGLQTLSTAIENIAKLSNRNTDSFSGLKSNLEKNIFDKIAEINAKNNEPQTEQETPREPKTQSGVGQSFEQIILNQAKAMQPAREAGSSSQQQVDSIKAEEKTEEKQKVIHNYIGGSDPYREPIE